MADPTTVIARFASPIAARRALQALSKAGIDGVHVALTGPGADRAEHSLDQRTSRIDRRELRWMAARIIVGAALGGTAGLLVAFVVSGFVSAEPRTVVFIGSFAIFAVIGGFVGGVRALPLSTDIDLTFADWPEPAELEVRIPGASVDHVNEMLEVLGAERVIRI